jgi:two-component system chemotaxis response regulator CheB
VYREIIAIGGSAGSLSALTQIIETLPAECSAAVFVVIHIPSYQKSHLAEVLASKGPVPAIQVSESQSIQGGKVYVAPPDSHMLIERGRVLPWRGPKEDRHRPAINPLFRSAAESYGSNVVGVVLSGALQDGSAGLWKIKQRGGLAVVQDPQTAPVRDMPESVLKYVEADHVLSSQDIAALLVRLSCDSSENRLTGSMMDKDSMETKVLLEARCPDCQGPLSEVHYGDVHEFRCLVGHSFSPQNILQAQSEVEENALWSAVVTIEESITLIRRLMPHLPSADAGRLEEQMEKRSQLAKEARRIIERLDSLQIP